jgi:hypothetical protein
MAKRLPKAAIKKVEAAVDSLFDKLKVRLLGPKSVDKKLYISFNREKSLPGLFEAAHIEERGFPDQEHLEQLLRIAENYLEAARLKAKSQTVVAVQNFMHDIAKARKRGDPKPDLYTVLGGELTDVYGKVAADVRRIVDTEAQNVRNVGVTSGIMRANASVGIEDPVIFFVVVRDQHLCDECRRLHLMPDGKTPRLWRMSDLGHDYHKRGESFPKVGGLHPHCRCSMTTLMPGFGFDKAGMVTWQGVNHDEYAIQQGKAEGLKKSTPAGLKTFEDLRPTWEASGEKYVNEKMANGHGMPEAMVNAIHTAPITMNFPYYVSKKLMEAGRFKNLFETGEGMGDTDTENRKGYEEYLGLSPTLRAHQRPLYGALHIFHEHPEYGPQGGAGSYGKLWITLHPDVKHRTTFTHDDSGDSDVAGHVFTHKHVQAAAHAKQRFQKTAFQRLVSHFLGYKVPPEGHPYHYYVEAQIHGGVDMRKDVHSIHVAPANNNSPSDQREHPRRLEWAIDLGKHFNLPVYHGDQLVHMPTPDKAASEGSRPAPPAAPAAAPSAPGSRASG